MVGQWGRLREKYLKKHEPDVYRVLKEQDKLEEHLAMYQDTYSEYARQLMRKLHTERGIDDDLRQRDMYAFLRESYFVCKDVIQQVKREILSGK